ncbi:MAG TPA: SiaB family protein kinase [Flavobacteriales bacterium]|jgi:hypothetical protein|nr:SiaB family protein kinase [Flavobacteriales bacterium]HOZ41495.1 SiaB family protein kinase [Flavobacteriales bacterium]
MSHLPHWSVPIAASLRDQADGVVLFEHHGTVDHDVVQHLLTLAEHSSIAQNDPLALRKRLFNVLVEGLENLHHHAQDDLKDTAWAMVVRAKEGYRMTFGNAMPQAMATLLAHRVEILNDMSGSDLKAHYMQLLANDARTERGGAGLGLYTMARKCERPLITHWLPSDERTVHFALELKVAF